MERVQPETCSSCGRIVFTARPAGLILMYDTEPLDGPGAAQELLGGRTVHLIAGRGSDSRSVAPAGPVDLARLSGEPELRPYCVREHPCTGFSRPFSPPPGHRSNPPVEGRQTAVQGLGGQGATDDLARTATRRRSDPVCNRCGAADGVRLYPCGRRCPEHTPARLAGKPEPPEGGGIDIVSIEVDGEVVWKAEVPSGTFYAG